MNPKPRLLTVLDIVTIILLLIATYMVFFYAPQEAVMGDVQRVFYFHVAAGWVGMLGFIGAAISGIITQLKKSASPMLPTPDRWKASPLITRAMVSESAGIP